MFSDNSYGASAPNPRPIVTCPCCRSIDIEQVASLPNAGIRQAVEIVCTGWWNGHRDEAARFLFRWVCVSAANAAQDKYRCEFCGHGFREGQS